MIATATIPTDLRVDQLGLRKGDELSVREIEDGKLTVSIFSQNAVSELKEDLRQRMSEEPIPVGDDFIAKLRAGLEVKNGMI